jgi:hypothetical protein
LSCTTIMTPKNKARGTDTETSSRRLSECTNRLQEVEERASANR